jgi:hypothetical protein
MTFFKPPGQGTLQLRKVAESAAKAAQPGFKWGTWVNPWCSGGTTQWYLGDFATSNDKGPVIACVSPGSGTLYAVYRSLNFDVEGGLFFSGPGPAAFAVFPTNPVSQQATEFSVSFRKHFAGDGAGPEESPASCGPRRMQSRTADVVQCKLDRVVFLEGTKFMQPAAESKEAAVGQYVYFRAAVDGHSLPLELLMLFPKEVKKDGVSVARENDMVNEKRAELDCPAAPASSAKRGFVLLCKVLSTSRSGVIVRVEVPPALRGKRLEVVLAAIRRKAGESTPEVLAKTTAGVELALEVSKPRAAPGAPDNDPVEGRWEEVQLVGSKLPAAFPGADIRITRARDDAGRLKEDLWVGRGSGVEVFLNRPKNENRVYDGSASGPNTGVEAVQLQLVTPGGTSIFPYCRIEALEKETYLCGWWIREPPCLPCGSPIVRKGEDPPRIVVLRKVGD